VSTTTITLLLQQGLNNPNYQQIRFHISMSNFSETWVDFIAGWASGAASVVLCQPLDTVLTRLQANSISNSSATRKVTAGVATAATTTCNINGMVSAPAIFRNMVSSFGVSSLWRGASPMISAVPFQNSLLMGGYGIGKQWAEQNNNSYAANSDTTNSNLYYDSVLLPVFVGGCTGGFIQSFLMSPIEWIKIRSQVAVATGLGGPRHQPAQEMMTVWTATQQLLLRPSAVMKCGLSATLWRDGIPHGVWFASYQWCKTILDERNNTIINLHDDNNDQNDPVIYGNYTVSSETHRQLTIPLVSGAFAATTAWVRVLLTPK
jgi:solute carrier family 25 (mitochondrial carnitine/acylcarnitine transporter), member 20/29